MSCQLLKPKQCKATIHDQKKNENNGIVRFIRTEEATHVPSLPLIRAVRRWVWWRRHYEDQLASAQDRWGDKRRAELLT
jgi:hypothetical protein